MQNSPLPPLAAGVLCPVLLALCAPAAYAGDKEEVAVSTPASPPQGRLTLNISKDSESSRVGLDYSLRWDFRDLLSLKPRLSTLASGVRAIYSWDITENTRVNYYGLRTNPWRLILSEKKNAVPPAGAGGSMVSGTQAQGGRRVRLSLSPLVDDVKRSIDEDLRDMLLKSSLRSAGPAWEKAGKEGRREFARDVLSLGIWDSGLPVLREGRAGLEYLGEEKPAAGLKRSTQSINIMPGARSGEAPGE